MIPIALHRSLSWVIACSDVRQCERGDTSHGWRDKSADVRRADVAGREGDLKHREKPSAGAFLEMSGKSIFRAPSPFQDTRSYQ